MPNTPSNPATIEPPSKKSIALAAGGALAVAVLVLVTAILPAEYGVDPLGTGQATGLINLFEASEEPAPLPDSQAAERPRVYKVESTSFTLRPSQPFEYKYRLEQGSGMVYAWKATGPVEYEFHGEPSDRTLPVQSYDKQRNDHAAGTLTASFSGIHGWYWENPGKEDLTLKLTTAGFYSSAEELRPVWDPEKHKNRIDRVPHELSTPPGFEPE